MATGGSVSWNLRTAVAACPIGPWRGEVWRCHTRRWSGDNADGSLKATGRYHRGRDRFPAIDAWPALYTALAPHIALGEMLRHTRALPSLASKRISRLDVSLSAVLDCASLLGSTLPGAPNLDDLCRPADYALPHEIAEAARASSAEALLIPTCTRLNGNNLIVFPDRLLPGSFVSVLGTEDPDLFIDWDAFQQIGAQTSEETKQDA
jgi:RES domain-containing protein